jgi:hypothetical protein
MTFFYPISYVEQEFSEAYFKAIAAISPINYTSPSSGNDIGDDHIIRRVVRNNGNIIPTGFPIPVQIKGTKNWIESNNEILFDMKASDYNRYSDSSVDVPILMILMCFPENLDIWLVLDEDKLQLMKCCYWKLFQEYGTDNSSSIRVSFPKANLLNQDSFQEIFALYTASISGNPGE